MMCVARDERGRWCLRGLAGGGWVAIEASSPEDAIAIATFVFEGRARRLDVLDVTEWHPSTRRGLEDARTLDDLIEVPPWIRGAVVDELRRARGARR